MARAAERVPDILVVLGTRKHAEVRTPVIETIPIYVIGLAGITWRKSEDLTMHEDPTSPTLPGSMATVAIVSEMPAIGRKRVVVSCVN